METCTVRCSWDSMVRTAKLSSDEVTCGTERLAHASHGATVSGAGELHCITPMGDFPTDAKLCPLQGVIEFEKGQRETTKTVKVMKQLVRRD